MLSSWSPGCNSDETFTARFSYRSQTWGVYETLKETGTTRGHPLPPPGAWCATRTCARNGPTGACSAGTPAAMWRARNRRYLTTWLSGLLGHSRRTTSFTQEPGAMFTHLRAAAELMTSWLMIRTNSRRPGTCCGSCVSRRFFAVRVQV